MTAEIYNCICIYIDISKSKSETYKTTEIKLCLKSISWAASHVHTGKCSKTLKHRIYFTQVRSL